MQVSPTQFEAAMRDLARQLWLPANTRYLGGATKIAGPVSPELGEKKKVDRDRDFVLETLDGFKYLEVSCRNDLAKATKDFAKLKSLVLERRQGGDNAQGYWITLEEMTTDARKLFDSNAHHYK